MQVTAAGYFPQGELANSPTWPVIIPKGAFSEGMAGQTVIGEMNQPNLVRVLDDEVDGVFQTALVPMFDGSPLGIGNNRMVFGNDGSLYVGKTALSWAGSKGMTKIKWNGKPFLSLEKIKALPKGFALRFSQPIDANTLKTLSVKRHTYQYHQGYGAPKKNEEVLKITGAKLSDDGMMVTLDVGALEEKYLHLIDMTGLLSKEGGKILGAKAWYHVVKAPK